MSDHHDLSPHIHLPPELWEEVILELGVVDALKMRVLNRAFCRLTDGSPKIQCRMELFATGLENGTHTNLFSPADQRAALETYRTRWERLEHAERVSLNTNDHWTTILDPLIIYQVAANNKYDFYFLQAPSPSKGLPQKEWVIRDLPGKPRCAAVQPAHDLVVMVESRPGPNEFMYYIRCLQLSTGRPHPRAWRSPLKTIGRGLKVKVSRHRLAALLEHGGFERCLHNQTLIVWDWEKGEMLHNAKAYFSRELYFIDDYRLAILRRLGLHNQDDSLLIYDTRGKPHVARELPQLALRLPEDTSAEVFHGPGEAPNHEGAVFTTNRGRCLLAIKMLVLDFTMKEIFFLVVAFEDLFALASRNAEKTMEFDEWKRVAHRVRIPPQPERGITVVGVCGLMVVVLGPDMSASGSQYKLWVCDFSPDARRTNLASCRQEKHALRQYDLRAPEALESNNRWTVFSEGLVLSETWSWVGPARECVVHVRAL